MIRSETLADPAIHVFYPNERYEEAVTFDWDFALGWFMGPRTNG